MAAAVLVAVAAAVTAGALAAPASAAPIRTGFADPTYFGSPERQATSFTRARAAGASYVRLALFWNEVAPGTRPPGFDPTNPADPAYNWAAFDRQVQLARSRGLEPIVGIMSAPPWASPAGSGIFRPDAVEFGNFARAAAIRYGGGYAGLPRVRHWMVWNEPNRDYFLMPQYENGRMVSPAIYRQLVARMSAAVRGVDSTNRVIGGGLAPLGRPGKPAPLAFMRQMLCVGKKLKRTCNLRPNPVRIDVWSHHPYTSGGPTHKAAKADDVSLGDLPAMRRIMRAAVRLGHVKPRGGLQLWVTEFSWDSDPPDPRAVPAALHARWVSEALYRMWRNDVRVITWFRIQDDPLSGPGSTPYQSGFYTVGGKPKRSLTAYRFPTVAFKRPNGIYVWGKTPSGRAANVVVQVKPPGKPWRRLGTLRANSGGMFQKTYRTPVRRGRVRARIGTTTSLPFSLAHVPDRWVNPFGCGGGIPC